MIICGIKRNQHLPALYVSGIQVHHIQVIGNLSSLHFFLFYNLSSMIPITLHNEQTCSQLVGHSRAASHKKLNSALTVAMG